MENKRRTWMPKAHYDKETGNLWATMISDDGMENPPEDEGYSSVLEMTCPGLESNYQPKKRKMEQKELIRVKEIVRREMQRPFTRIIKEGEFIFIPESKLDSISKALDEEFGEQETYSIGDKFHVPGFDGTWLLAACGGSSVLLVEIEKGSFLNDPEHVKLVTSISKEELQRISGLNKCEKLQ